VATPFNRATARRWLRRSLRPRTALRQRVDSRPVEEPSQRIAAVESLDWSAREVRRGLNGGRCRNHAQPHQRR